MPALVALREVGKVYDTGAQQVPALRGIDLEVSDGEYVAVMGHSGSGKSTLLNLLGCLDRPTSGSYLLGGEEVSAMSDSELSEIRNTRIGFVFQSFNLISGLSVTANIEVPMFYKAMSRRDRHARSRELAEAVGLERRSGHRPNELSGGQRQRVAIARALANDPLILLADEPTGNLDSTTSEEILALFDELQSRGRTVIMVTHEDYVAERAERVIWLADGRVDSDTPNGRLAAGGAT